MTALAASGFATTAQSGSILLAIPVAALAGLVSFASPCVLPLVPGYLSYVTGLSGADLTGQTVARRGRTGRVLLGSSLFVLGFSALFVSFGALLGHVGGRLQAHHTAVTDVLGALTIVLGLVFLGFVPGLQRDVRLHSRPALGLVGAPVLGVLFGLGWTPCIGPTLAAVQALAEQSGTAGRGALLSFVYCLGLGLPFVLAGLAFRRALSVFAVLRRHSALIMRIGGGLLVGLGICLVTGWWADFSRWMLHLYSGFTPAV